MELRPSGNRPESSSSDDDDFGSSGTKPRKSSLGRMPLPFIGGGLQEAGAKPVHEAPKPAETNTRSLAERLSFLVEAQQAKAVSHETVEPDDEDDDDTEEDTKKRVEAAAPATEDDSEPAIELSMGPDLADEHVLFDSKQGESLETPAEHAELGEQSDNEPEAASPVEGDPGQATIDYEPIGMTAEADDEDEPLINASATATTSGGSGGGTTPPPVKPPSPPSSTGGSSGFGGGGGVPGGGSGGWFAKFNQAPPYVPLNYNMAPKPNVATSSTNAERARLRRRLIAGFLVGYALKAYLDGRKRERQQKITKREIKQRDEHIEQLQRERQELRDRQKAQTKEFADRLQRVEEQAKAPRLEKQAALPKVETLPPVHVTPAEQIFDKEGNEIILQHGWRVERAAGGYSVVVNEKNQVVYEAIHYGEAYQKDQKRERINDDIFAPASAAVTTASTTVDHPDVQLASGLTEPSHQLPPSDGPQADLQHRLSAPDHSVKSLLGNPWLWTALAVLISAYFIAALA